MSRFHHAPALLLFALLFPALPCPCTAAARSSSLSPRTAPPEEPADAEIIRDAPLYPPLQDYDSETPYKLQTNTFPSKPAHKDTYNDRVPQSQQYNKLSDDSYYLDTRPEYSKDTNNNDIINFKQLQKLFYNTTNDVKSHNTFTIQSDSKFSDVESSEYNATEDILFQLQEPLLDTNDLIDNYDEKAAVIESALNEADIILENGDNPFIDETEKETYVQNNEEEGKEKRYKRSSNKETDRPTRVKTGDTILNIRGALRDAIGDAGAMPGGMGSGTGGASSRVDAFVIRPDSTTRNMPRDPPIKLLKNQAPKDDRELLVMAHSRVRVPCDLSNITNLRWFKDKEQISVSSGAAAGEAMWREPGALIIARAAPPHAAAWRCAGLDSKGGFVSGKPVRLLIYEPVRAVYLAVDGRRLDAGNTWVPVRDKTLLEVHCVAEGGVPAPELNWKLLAIEPTLDHRPYLRIHPTNYSVDGVSSSRVVVTAARELHNATLHCEGTQRLPPIVPPATPPTINTDAMAAKLEIHVTYPPSFVISRWPGFGVALVAGGAAALRCDVDANPPAKAFWLRDDAHQSSSPPPLEEGAEARGSATLRWATLRADHAGWYRCRASWLDAEYSSIGYFLNVLSPEDIPAPPQEEAPAEHQTVEVPVGGNAQLHCPKGSVGCWWRRVAHPEGEAHIGGHLGVRGDNTSAAWTPTGSTRAHGVLAIKDALYQDGGEYRCVGASAADATRVRELKRVTVKVNGGVTATAVSAVPTKTGWRLQCGACGRALRVLWLIKQQPPQPATLSPDLPQHCWRAELHVTEPDEVWCVAVSGSGGAAAVFPARAPSPSPAPARHSVKGPQNTANLIHTSLQLVLTSLLLLLME